MNQPAAGHEKWWEFVPEVLGCENRGYGKTEDGVDVVPVPVYYPDVTHILGKPVYRRLVDIPGELDLVDVFRRPQDIDQHVDDILAKKPRAVWFQSGIRNDAAARRLAEAGIKVVQDRCLMVDHRRYGR